MATNSHENTSLKLSIQVSLNGLSFCILNTESRQIVYYRRHFFEQQLDPIKTLAQIELQYEKEEQLQQEINEVKLLFSNQLYSLVPSKYFREENASSFLKFNTKILKTDFVAHDELEKQPIVNVYIPYANILNYFFEKYGEFEYKHSISVLVESLLKRPGRSQPTMYINKKSKDFDLVVIENRQLLLCNSFTYETKEDFLYYILFTAEQLNLNPERFELVLLGDISENSSELALAKKYVKNVKFLEDKTSYEFATTVEKPARNTEDYIIFNSL